MTQRDNIIPISSGAASGARRRIMIDDHARRLLASCRATSANVLQSMVTEVFEHADDAMFQSADKAERGEQQAAYFDAMLVLRRERKAVETRFQNALLGHFDRFWIDASAPYSDAAGLARNAQELNILGESELEESLAVSNMIAKAQNRFSGPLHGLNRRFSALTGGAAVVNDDNNPLGPKALGYAIREAVGAIKVDPRIRLVIYKLFDRFMIVRLGELFDPINDLLKDGGVLPELRHEVAGAGNRSRSAASVAPQEAAAKEQLHEFAGEAGADVQLYDTLRGLLGRHPGRANARQAIPPGMAPFESDELITALSRVQEGAPVLLPPGSHGAYLGGGREVLLERLHGLGAQNRNKVFGRADSDTIDVITMLFEFILEDTALPDAMKALLSRLQIPMLKVALLDRRFFSHKTHPARRLLNALAQAAIGWSESDGRGADSVFARIEGVVQRILAEFTDDIALFDSLLADFTAVSEREARSAAAIERRVTTATRGQHRMAEAQARVETEVRRRIGERQLPEAVLALIDEGWRDVLRLTLLRDGADSQEWHKRLEVLELLIWSVEPKTTRDARQALLNRIPALLRAVRENLGGISFDHRRLGHLLKDLQALHFACLRGEGDAAEIAAAAAETIEEAGGETDSAAATPQPARGPTAPVVPTSRHAAQVEEIVLASPSSLDEHVTDEFSAQARELGEGAWVEFIQGDDRTVRAKLAWKSDVNSRYVFVDRRGARVAEVSPNGLAASLRRGGVRLLEQAEVPLMDRALDAMLSVLRTDSRAPAKPESDPA